MALRKMLRTLAWKQVHAASGDLPACCPAVSAPAAGDAGSFVPGIPHAAMSWCQLQVTHHAQTLAGSGSMASNSGKHVLQISNVLSI